MSAPEEHIDDTLGVGSSGDEYTLEMMLAEFGELINDEAPDDNEPMPEALGSDEKALRLFEDLNVDIRWSNKFEEAGIFTVGDLLGFSTDELLGLKGIGITAIAELERGLSDKGLPTIGSLSRFEKTLKKVHMEHRSSKNRFRPFAADVTMNFHTGPNHHIALDHWKQHTLFELPFVAREKGRAIEQYDFLELETIPGLLELIPFPQNLYLGAKETVSVFLTCSVEHIITDCGFDAASKIVDTLLGHVFQIDPRGFVLDTYCAETARNFPSELSSIPLLWLFPELDSGLVDYEYVGDLLGENKSVLSVYLASAISESLSRLLMATEIPIDLGKLFKNILIELDVDADDRSIEIYIKRNGLGTSKMTLEEVGAELGVTRERIRQIESKITERLRPLRSERLLLLRMAMLGIAKKTKAFGSLDDLSEAYVKSGLFSDGTNILGLLELLPEYHIDRSSNTYVLDGYSCINCDNALQAIHELRTDSAIVTHSSFWDIVGCETCEAESAPPISLFDGVDGIRVSAELIGAANNPVMKASLRPTSERALLHAILYEADCALTYDEMIERVYEKTGNKPSKNKVGSQVGSFEDCMLWGRGTYIHEKNAPQPKELLQIISDLISDVFRINQIPIVGVEGIFSKFEDQLTEQGIPTHHALYSLLRKRSDPRLKLQEYPWICDINTIGDRTSFAKYFYSILEDNNGFITDEHAKTIADKTMAQSFALGGLAEYSPFVINANGGWYDIEAAGFDMEGIASLAEEVAEGMRENDIVSAVMVFDEHRERCFKYGVKSYDMLYYLVDMMEDDLPIEATRKPHFVKSKHKGLSAISVMRMYIEDADEPVSRDELYEEFVTKRRLNLRGICGSLLVNKDIVAVGNDMYWSREKLTMDEDFMLRFDRAISDGIRRAKSQKVAHLYYPRNCVIPNLATLPEPFGLKWNTVLLNTAFSKSNKYRLYGENGSCIISLDENPNVEDVETFYRELLNKEFYGWSSFDAFVEYCDAHQIRSRLEPEFFDAFSSIKADEISIQIA